MILILFKGLQEANNIKMWLQNQTTLKLTQMQDYLNMLQEKP